MGAKTGDVLTLVTLGLAIVYAGLAICMNWWFLPIGTTAPPTPAVGPAPGSPPASGGPPATPFIDESAGLWINTPVAAELLLFGDPDTWAQPGGAAA